MKTKEAKLNKIRITFTLPKKACMEVRERMLKEGYSLREKSKWYSEAMRTFLKKPNFHEYVEMASLVDDLSQVETISIPEELEEQLEKALIKVRKKFPTIEGVKSLIVRASVVQGLLQPLVNS